MAAEFELWGPFLSSRLLWQSTASRGKQLCCEAHLLNLVEQWQQQIGPVRNLRERGLEQELVLAADCLRVQSRLLQALRHVSTAALAAMGAPCSPPCTRRAGLDRLGRQQWSVSSPACLAALVT